MKTIGLIFALTFAANAGCLVIDSLVVIPATCASGTCDTGPGVVGSAEFRAMLVPSFRVAGHNSCKTTQPPAAIGATRAWTVTVAFYDAASERVGLLAFVVDWLGAGEKFKHNFDIPGDALVNGPVTAVSVRSIEAK